MMAFTDLEKIRQTPIFFIVGRPRTGSTLLRTLFDAHPNITIPQESPMLLALYKKFGKITYWNPNILEDFYKALFQHLRISYWEITNWPKFDKEALHSSILACEGEHSFETIFKVVCSHYQSYFEKKEILLIGDKNPVYSNQVVLLASIFPTAKFIHLTRDYRDNIVSLLDVDFEMPNTAVLTYRWKYSWKVIESAAHQYPDRFITVKYEDLVDNPPAHFNKLCDFLGIPFDPSIFSFHSRKAEIEKTFPKEVIDRYFRSLFQPIDSSRVEVYKTRLSLLQVKVADSVAGKTAELAGYKRESNRFSLPVYIWSLPAVLYAKWLYSVGWIVSLLPYRSMMWLLNKPSVIVKLYTVFLTRDQKK